MREARQERQGGETGWGRRGEGGRVRREIENLPQYKSFWISLYQHLKLTHSRSACSQERNPEHLIGCEISSVSACLSQLC